ncbi:phosphatase PAP2 family protein [Streptomyces chiangmaiensis]|uniref:Phosphatase PAP2 family protein n=1 Tax=Streptomyces chiangmaiensis TaxID=766497 RepID=A0ABU7FEC9_9ACTN|nr:phosphatase PAP2 family protein [Streptomyces chiangmaiensis]MED7822449.1 phosphatase PAP2 family protein [Streptomyces chiangmaiensis]
MHLAPVKSPAHRSSPRAAALSAAALAVTSLTLLLLVALSWQPLMALDDGTTRTMQRWAVGHRGTTHAFRILTDWVWGPATMRILCAAAVLWLLWRRRAWQLALWVAMACALGALVQNSLKALVGRARPVWPDPVDSAHGSAFPSGHAMTATVVCGLLLWILHRCGARGVPWHTAWAAAVVSVVGVGLTRVWLGVHWPSDVAGGWLLGALLVVIAVASYERWGAYEEDPEEPVPRTGRA